MSLYEIMALTCPFEKVKRWRTGVSVKCPKMTTITWTMEDQDKAIYHIQSINRRTTCINCKEAFMKFFNEVEDKQK